MAVARCVQHLCDPLWTSLSLSLPLCTSGMTVPPSRVVARTHEVALYRNLAQTWCCCCEVSMFSLEVQYESQPPGSSLGLMILSHCNLRQSP